jgi:O-antigen/teichoic acid export membrane protein
MAVNISRIKELTKSSTIRGVSVLAGGSALAQSILLAALPLLTRMYSPAEFSLLAIYTSILGILVSIVCLRFEIAVPIAESAEEGAKLVIICIFCSLVLSALWATLLLFFGDPIARQLKVSGAPAVLWLIPVGTAAYGIYAALQNWAVRQKSYSEIFQTRISQAVGGVATQIGLGWAGPIGLVLGHIVSGAAGVVRLGLNFLPQLRVHRAVGAKALWATALKFRRFPTYSVVESLSNSAAMMLPVLIIASVLPGEEAGQLGLATRVMSVPLTLIGAAVGQVFLSSAAERHRAGELGPFVRSAVVGIARVVTIPVLLVAALAPWGFPLLFGAEWHRAGWLASWLMPSLLLQMFVSPVSMALHVIQAQATAMKLQIFGLVIRVGSVLCVSVFAPRWVSETYAVSGILFYAIYLLLVLKMTTSAEGRVE